MDAFEATTRRGGDAALREASRFFMQADPVYDSLREIAKRLPEIGVPYAILGGMALVAHGYRRTTEDVDILITPEGLERVHEKLVGLGYRPAFEKSRNLRDTRTGVRIELVISGGFPGDGKPKPVAFPDPDTVAVEIDGIRYVNLPTLVELKLASGMSNPGRLRDLADVQELVRALKLGDDFAEGLHPYVQQKFRELAQAIPQADQSDAPTTTRET
ncbi:MAG: nucleotidyltransferase family protein [Planctomycetes bacterium]|nr:nucleotidyltransferase family protein [Planctomycetota bacterium]